MLAFFMSVILFIYPDTQKVQITLWQVYVPYLDKFTFALSLNGSDIPMPRGITEDWHYH